MTSQSPRSNRRPSLCPPHRDAASPNASMVDASNVQRSIVKHIQQRDQDTATEEEQKQKLNEQRFSLAHALKTLDDWHKNDSPDIKIKTNHIQQEPKIVTSLNKQHSSDQ